MSTYCISMNLTFLCVTRSFSGKTQWFSVITAEERTNIILNCISNAHTYEQQPLILRLILSNGPYNKVIFLCLSSPVREETHRVTRVNSTNVLDEGLMIGGTGCRMNSKVKISQTRRVLRINVVIDLAYSQSVPDQPILAPIYRWPGLKEPVGFDTYYNIDIRHGLVLRLWLHLGPA
jgi:hypothetical protein